MTLTCPHCNKEAINDICPECGINVQDLVDYCNEQSNSLEQQAFNELYDQ